MLGQGVGTWPSTPRDLAAAIVRLENGAIVEVMSTLQRPTP